MPRPSSEFGSSEANEQSLKNEKTERESSWTQKIAKSKRSIGALMGLIGLVSILGTRREHVDPSEAQVSERQIGLDPIAPSIGSTVNENETRPERQEAMLRNIAYYELSQELEQIVSGQSMEGKYKGKLITLENEEIGDDFRKIIETAVKESAALEGQEKLDFLGASIGLILDYYNKVMREIDNSDTGGQTSLRQESALALSAMINEYLAGKPAGSLDSSVASAAEASLVTDADNVIKEMGLSTSEAQIDGGSISLEIDGEPIDLTNAQFIQNFYGKAVEVPLQFASGVKLTNLYDIRETDREQFKKIVDMAMASNPEALSQYAEEALGQDLAPGELRDMLITGEQHELSSKLPFFERLSLDFEITKLWDIIPMPTLDVEWKGNTSKETLSYQMNAEGGKIAATMLCQGNHIEIITLSSRSSLIEPGKDIVKIPLLVLLIPLLAAFKRKKKETEEDDRPTPEENLREGPVTPPDEGIPPFPNSLPRPDFPDEPIASEDSPKHHVDRPEQDTTKPRQYILTDRPPTEVRENDGSELEIEENNIVYHFGEDKMVVTYRLFEQEQEAGEETIFVVAEIKIARDGSIRIIRSGEAGPTEIKKGDFEVTSVGHTEQFPKE